MRMMGWASALAATIMALVLFACGSGSGSSTVPGSGSPNVAQPTKPGHVFIIVLENEGYDETFSATSVAPYLSKTLTAQGALLKNYYGTGHNSLDNYISMVSGQAPSLQTQSDCVIYTDWLGLTNLDGNGQVTGLGCVYPTTVMTVANQLQAAGLSWKGYMEDMGNDLKRDGSTTCSHPSLNSQDGTQSAEATDNYATRHNPFMYFHAIIDDAVGCNQKVVNLQKLDVDLAQTSTTANYNFITPNLCNDGHDATCADGSVGGLARADKFLQTVVPKILNSPAYKQDGLLIVTFDEAEFPQDATACCGEASGPNTLLPGLVGPGGGVIGAVLLSPFIKPGTVSTTPYNHYSMLRSIEDLFGLDYLGFAGAKGLQSFGSDVYGH